MNENMYNLGIERAVLSSIIFDPEMYDSIAYKLKKHDFYLPFHKHLFGVFAALHQEEKPIEEEFLRSRLKSMGVFDEVAMFDVLSATPISNVQAYIDDIKEMSAKRDLAVLASEIRKAVLEDDLPYNQVSELIMSKVEEIQANGTRAVTSIEDFLDVYTDKKYLAEPKDLKQILHTKAFFYDGGLHLVHGLSKMGKTWFVLEMLNNVTTHKVLWLDGDNNDSTMSSKFPNIRHIPPLEPNAWLNRIIDRNINLSGYIIVLDSLKDYTNGEDIDTNGGANAVMQHIKHLTRLGATVVIVAHSTPTGTRDKPGKPKIKGNSEYIYANVDITYLFERDFETQKRTVTVERSRVPGVLSGTVREQKELGEEFIQLTVTSNSESKKEEVISWQE